MINIKLTNYTRWKINIDEVINIIKNPLKIKKIIIISMGVILTVNNKVYAQPSTGFAPMDNGAWQLVKVFQAAIFWVSMIYSLKHLLEFSVKGKGDWKDITTGFLICIADYLVPWLFGLIPNMFKF